MTSQAGYPRAGPGRVLFGASWSAIDDIFLVDGLGQIDASDIGKGRKPRQNVGKLFFKIALVGLSSFEVGDGLSQFADFFHEPKEGLGRASRGVRFVVPVADEGLELAEGWVLHGWWGGSVLR